MKTLRSCLTAILLLVFISVPTFNAQAAAPSVTVTSIFIATCSATGGTVFFNYTASGLTVPGSYDVQFSSPGGTSTTTNAGSIQNTSTFGLIFTPFPNQLGSTWIMTMKLIFRTSVGGPIISTATLQGSCDVATNTFTVTIVSGGGGPGRARFTDGRLNDQDYGQSAAVYCEDGGITVYGFSGKWGSYLAFKVSKADLAKYPEKPAQNTLIIEKFGIRLYKLTSGEYQINAATDEAGKEYVFRWTGCPTS